MDTAALPLAVQLPVKLAVQLAVELAVELAVQLAVQLATQPALQSVVQPEHRSYAASTLRCPYSRSRQGAGLKASSISPTF
jgi:hypothetical protein